MHIRVITPITTPVSPPRRTSSRSPVPTRSSANSNSTSAPSIESAFDEALALPDTIAKIVQAEQEVSMQSSSTVSATPAWTRDEATEMLVLGPAQTSMHRRRCSARSSVVTVLEAVVPMLEDLATKYGLADKLCSIRMVDIPCSSRPARAARACAGGRGCESRRGGRRPRDRLRVHWAAAPPDCGPTSPRAVTRDPGDRSRDRGVQARRGDRGPCLAPSKRTYTTPREKALPGFEHLSLAQTAS